VRDLGLRPAEIGLVLAVGQTGGLLGAAVANRLARRFGPGPTMTAACMLAGPDLLLIGLAPRSLPVPFLAAGLFLGSFVSLITGIVGVSIRQAIVPQRLQGRVVGSIRWIILGILPLGSLFGGLLASSIGPRGALLVGAGIASFTFVPLALSPMRRLRVLPEVADALPTIAP
jgi:MFS family permease